MATHATHKIPGKKRGGARPGGGRPKGSTNALPMGAVKALKSIRLRVPDDAPEEAKQLADRALQRIADVMNEKVSYRRATSVLKSAVSIREEVCGPVTRKVEVEAKVGIAALLDEASRIEREEKKLLAPPVVEAEALPPPRVVQPVGPIIRRKSQEAAVVAETTAASMEAVMAEMAAQEEQESDE